MYKSLLSLVVSVFAISTVFGGSPGQLDPTFGTGGIVTANIGKFSGDTAVAAALQPDGKILIVGGSTSNSEFSPESGTSYLARINTDGTLDKSFGAHGSGFTPLVGSVSGVSIRPDARSLWSALTLWSLLKLS